jgi:hypothetical protein
MEETVLHEIFDSESDWSVRLEDDARVAYAYLVRNHEILGDVWLYNAAPTPQQVDWDDPEQLPFLNPEEFCEKDQGAVRLRQDSQVECKWKRRGGQLLTVDVSVDGVPMARLAPGAKPGWSVYAAVDNPLAKRLRG